VTTSIKPLLVLCHVTLILFPFKMHFMSTKPALNDHQSYVTIFHCSLGRSHKTGLTVCKYRILIVMILNCMLTIYLYKTLSQVISLIFTTQ